MATFMFVWRSLGDFTKCNFYFVTHFMSKRNFYFEIEEVVFSPHCTCLNLLTFTVLHIRVGL